MISDTSKSMDQKHIDELFRISKEVSPLGIAGVISRNIPLKNALVSATDFLPAAALMTERLYCVVNGITTQPMCEVCNSRPTTWNPHKKCYRPTCGPVCGAVKTPMRDRKTKQRQLDVDFSSEIETNINLSMFDPNYAAKFIRENCLRKDGQINGNLSTKYRNFVRVFGWDEFNKVLSDYYLNHRAQPFAEYAYTLDKPVPLCKHCGVNVPAFDNYRDGYRLTCSIECGNNLSDKKDTIRAKLLNPDQGVLERRVDYAEDRFNAAIEKHEQVIADENQFKILASLPRHDIKQFDFLRYKFECRKCSSVFESTFRNRRCYACEPKVFGLETEVSSYFTPSHHVETNRRSLLEYKRLELDVYFPQKNFAVEIDGVFWHSFGAEERDLERTQKNDHFQKFEMCRDRGIRLLSILDIEWADPVKREICLSMIRNRLGESERIFARNCEIREVPSDEARSFLNRCHIQGACMHTVAHGLYQDDRIVAIMTWGKPRFSKHADYELLRFCCDLNHTVVGGASRLLKHFERLHPNASLLSYANRRFGSGGMYERLGFKLTSVSRPNYFWIKGGQLWHRMKFQKHKLEKLLPEFDPSKTEADNMFAAGYRRLWDYGHFVYIKKN